MIHKTYEDGILYNGDCLKVMPRLIKQGIKVDAIITDVPYGTTACQWDSIIPLDLMWKNINKLIKPNGAICLFGNEPFTSNLICSNLDGFKYRWDWNKHIPSGMGYAKYRPMQQTEDISVFSLKGKKLNYYPQMIKRDSAIVSGGNTIQAGAYFNFKCIDEGKEYKKTYTEKFPITLIEFNKVRQGSLHPTQKPVPLMEYLIKTYTKEGETILDFTCGSGSTLVACRNLNRKFIGIELDSHYYKVCKQRLAHECRKSLF